MRPMKPDSRANCGVMARKPIGSIESTSISPSSMRYRAPTLTWGDPESDAACDLSATNAVAKTLGEDHDESLLPVQDCHFDTLAGDPWSASRIQISRAFEEPLRAKASTVRIPPVQ